MDIAIIVIQAVVIYLLILKCNKWKKECYKWINKWTILNQKIKNG